MQCVTQLKVNVNSALSDLKLCNPGGVDPSGTLQEPHDEIMLSQGLAVHCIVVGHDSGHIHFKVEGDSLCSNLSCRKESTTPIVHLRGSSRREEHQFANILHFSA